MSLQGTKKVGLIGGSFDPVHSGHLMIAQDAADRLELDEVVFIPANILPREWKCDRLLSSCGTANEPEGKRISVHEGLNDQ